MLSECAILPQNLHVFTNPEALRTLSFWVFIEASLHTTLPDMIFVEEEI